MLEIGRNILFFIPLIAVVVFAHEFGHFWVARRCGVKIDAFSIGFGPELWGWNDRYGTRWKISALPLGGYVKMFGDADASSAGVPDQELSPEDQRHSFRHKSVGQRAAIAFAGPAANFLSALVAMTLMYLFLGQQVAEPVLGEVMPDSAAAESGLHTGDQVITINGQSVARFEDIRRLVVLLGVEPLQLVIARDGATLDVTVRPHLMELRGMSGDMEKVPVLGVKADPDRVTFIHHGPLSAFTASVHDITGMVTSTMTGIGQMITGARGADGLGGPIRIAKAAGEASRFGLTGEISLAITLSVGLGLFNLFPIPILDGGHLLFCAIEAVLGRPLNERMQEYGFRIGMFLVLALMVFATRNDLMSTTLWQTVSHWVN